MGLEVCYLACLGVSYLSGGMLSLVWRYGNVRLEICYHLSGVCYLVWKYGIACLEVCYRLSGSFKYVICVIAFLCVIATIIISFLNYVLYTVDKHKRKFGLKSKNAACPKLASCKLTLQFNMSTFILYEI